MWKIVYKKSVQKDLKSIPKSVQLLIKKTIEEKLATNPFMAGVPLKRNFSGFMKKRVGPYRIIYSIDKKTIILLVSIFLSFIWFLFAQWEWVSRWTFLSVHDNFYRKCIEWKNKEIILTLKNGKAYHSILWKYPDPQSKHESQTISVIPFKSGYREEKSFFRKE